MKILSDAECQEWLESKRGKGVSWRTVEADYPQYVKYGLPAETGRKTALSREVTHSVDTSQCGLLWVTDWSIFPSSQNMALFDGYRKSLGEDRPIIEAPGHIFGESDLQELECLFGLALYFFWDAYLFEQAGRTVVRINHHDFISVHARDSARLSEFQNIFERLKLERWGPP